MDVKPNLDAIKPTLEYPWTRPGIMENKLGTALDQAWHQEKHFGTILVQAWLCPGNTILSNSVPALGQAGQVCH